MKLIKIEKDQEICECGHKRNEHNSWGTECYKIKKNKGQTFQCICREFKERKIKNKELYNKKQKEDKK